VVGRCRQMGRKRVCELTEPQSSWAEIESQIRIYEARYRALARRLFVAALVALVSVLLGLGAAVARMGEVLIICGAALGVTTIVIVGTVFAMNLSRGIACPRCGASIRYEGRNTSRLDILRNLRQCPFCQHKFVEQTR